MAAEEGGVLAPALLLLSVLLQRAVFLLASKALREEGLATARRGRAKDRTARDMVNEWVQGRSIYI